MRFLAVLAAGLAGGVLLLPGPAAGAATPHYVGIVIGERYACVRWHAGITGDDVLNRAADVTYRSDGIVLTINGAPDPPHADDTHYWTYWHDTGARWQYSPVGASGYRPAAGTVEGWNYDDGQAHPPPPASDPSGLYASICGARDATPTPSATPTPTRARTSTHAPVSSTTHSARPTPTRSSSSAPAPRTTSAISSPPAATARPTKGTPSPHPAHRRHHGTTVPPTPVDSAPSSSQPALRPAAKSLQPLPKPGSEAGSDSGSPLPLLLGVGAAVLIGAAGALTALRRRWLG